MTSEADTQTPITPIGRLCVVGVGLIGGSLARAARAAGLATEIIGTGRDAAHLERALALGVIDGYELDIGRAITGADMVVVAVPLGAVEAVFQAMAPHLAPGTVVTDVGSAKGSVLEAARRVFGSIPAGFVPGHPVAGTERSGVEASFAELFAGRRVILTPVSETDAQAIARVRTLWEQAGAEVVEMSAQHHDDLLAATSHLPHLLAYTLVDTLARMDESAEIFRFAAGGFRDFTRIASSDPVMWRDICLANRSAIVKTLERFGQDLEGLAEAIRGGDGEAILAVFRRAKEARDRYAETDKD